MPIFRGYAGAQDRRKSAGRALQDPAASLRPKQRFGYTTFSVLYLMFAGSFASLAYLYSFCVMWLFSLVSSRSRYPKMLLELAAVAAWPVGKYVFSRPSSGLPNDVLGATFVPYGAFDDYASARSISRGDKRSTLSRGFSAPESPSTASPLVPKAPVTDPNPSDSGHLSAPIIAAAHPSSGLSASFEAAQPALKRSGLISSPPPSGAQPAEAPATSSVPPSAAGQGTPTVPQPRRTSRRSSVHSSPPHASLQFPRGSSVAASDVEDAGRSSHLQAGGGGARLSTYRDVAQLLTARQKGNRSSYISRQEVDELGQGGGGGGASAGFDAGGGTASSSPFLPTFAFLNVSRYGIQGVVFGIFCAPVLVTVHVMLAICTWFGMCTMPLFKLHITLLRELLSRPDELSAAPLELFDPRHDTLVCVFAPYSVRYFSYEVFGMNVVIVNLLASVVPFALLLAICGMVNEHVFTHPSLSILMLALGMCAAIPLSHLVGMAVSTLARNSTYALGAFLNATFGSVIETVLAYFFLRKGDIEVIAFSLTGSILVSLLLLPGAAILVGCFRNTSLRFNPTSQGLQSALLIFALSCLEFPQVFYTTYASVSMQCSRCRSVDESAPHSTFSTGVTPTPHSIPSSTPFAASNLLFNATSPSPGHGHLPTPTPASALATTFMHSLDCDRCVQTKLPYWRSNALLHHSIPLITATCVALPLVYGASVVFTQLTHSFIYLLPLPAAPVREEEPSDTEENAPEHAADWSKAVCAVVLVLSMTSFGVIAEGITSSMEPAIEVLGVPKAFVAATLVAIVPSIAEIANAVMFARHGNVSLSLEIGSVGAIQMLCLQLPVVVLMSWVMQSDVSEMFLPVLPATNVLSIFVGIVVLVYISIDGVVYYIEGLVLLAVYVVALVLLCATSETDVNTLAIERRGLTMTPDL